MNETYVAPGFRHGSGRGALGASALVATMTARAGGSRQSGGGTLNILMPAGDPDHLDPALWYSLVSWYIGFTICTRS